MRRWEVPNYHRPHLAHLGIFVRDVEKLERFYTEVFGLIVTDRGVGKTFRNELVFLSGAPDQHHQLVLSGGRGAESPSTVMQISFKVTTLSDLRGLRDKALARGASELIGLNHGNSWSIYFFDPEGNRVEVYLDTPFHTPQPCGEPLNLEQSDLALLAETEALVATLPGSMPRSDYVAQMTERLS
jgi:catechol 2,3-dioxygenase